MMHPITQATSVPISNSKDRVLAWVALIIVAPVNPAQINPMIAKGERNIALRTCPLALPEENGKVCGTQISVAI